MKTLAISTLAAILWSHSRRSRSRPIRARVGFNRFTTGRLVTHDMTNDTANFRLYAQTREFSR